MSSRKCSNCCQPFSLLRREKTCAACQLLFCKNCLLPDPNSAPICRLCSIKREQTRSKQAAAAAASAFDGDVEMMQRLARIQQGAREPHINAATLTHQHYVPPTAPRPPLASCSVAAHPAVPMTSPPALVSMPIAPSNLLPSLPMNPIVPAPAPIAPVPTSSSVPASTSLSPPSPTHPEPAPSREFSSEEDRALQARLDQLRAGNSHGSVPGPDSSESTLQSRFESLKGPVPTDDDLIARFTALTGRPPLVHIPTPPMTAQPEMSFDEQVAAVLAQAMEEARLDPQQPTDDDLADLPFALPPASSEEESGSETDSSSSSSEDGFGGAQQKKHRHRHHHRNPDPHDHTHAPGLDAHREEEKGDRPHCSCCRHHHRRDQRPPAHSEDTFGATTHEAHTAVAGSSVEISSEARGRNDGAPHNPGSAAGPDSREADSHQPSTRDETGGNQH